MAPSSVEQQYLKKAPQPEDQILQAILFMTTITVIDGELQAQAIIANGWFMITVLVYFAYAYDTRISEPATLLMNF